MSELLNFPFINQLDGTGNAEFDCVPACLTACLRYTTGNTGITASGMLDAVYGSNWVNSGTAASAFVDYCAAHAARLYAVETSSNAEAVQMAHTLLARGLPVVFTQQDDYAPPQFQASWTHVCAWFKDAPGTLTAMDPFGAREITFSDSVWAQRLRNTEVWTMEKTTMIPQGWHDDGTILTAPNNVPVKLGFRQYILTRNWDPNNWPLQAEQGTAQLELSNPALGGGTWQPFRWTVLEWDAHRGVQEMWTGQEILAERGHIAELQAELASAQQSALQQQLDTLEQRLAQIKQLATD